MSRRGFHDESESQAIHVVGQCSATGKRQYADRASAKSARRVMKTQGLDVKSLRPYRCAICGHYELGTYRIHGEPASREHHRVLQQFKNPDTGKDT